MPPRMPIRLLEEANIASAYPRELVANFSTGDLTLVGSNGTSQVKIPGNLTKEVTGSGNAVTNVEVSGHKITITKASSFLTAHPTITKSTNESGTTNLAYSGTFNAVESVTQDANGHITKVTTKTVKIPAAQTTITGNAGSASKLATARTITLSGAASGSASFDGSADVEIEVADISAGNVTGLAAIATSGAYADITGKPSLASVATSGKYSDLSGTPSIPTASTVVGATPGTAAVGTSTAYARADHVHPVQTTVSGNAGSASKLATARTISLKNGAVGSVSFDGSTNVEIDVTKIDATKISGVLDIANIPPKALERLCIVETDSARLALTINDVQNGDCVKVTDTGLMYFVKDDSKLGTTSSADAFEAFTAGTAAAVDWGGITNKPSFANVATSGKYSDLSGTPSIPTASTVVGATPGTAAVGTSTAYARADHVHPVQTSVSGTAGSAAEFTAAKSVALTGDVTGSASSKAGWSVATTLANSGVTAGSYGQSAAATPAHGGSFTVPKVTVDAKGRVTAASNISVTLPSESSVGVSVTGDGNAVTAIAQNGHGITVTKGASFLTAHPTITKSTNTTSTASPAHGGTFTAIDSVTQDANGHITKVNTKTVTLPTVPAVTIDSELSTTSTNAVQNKVVTTALNGKASTGHTHSYASSSSVGGAANSVKAAMTVKLNSGTTEGTDLFTFNGSAAKTINITAASVGAASTATYTATIGTSWSGSAAPYTQAITVSGITASDNPIVDVKPSDTYATGKSQVEAWGSIYRIVTAANSITVYANEKTTTSIPIQLKCVR